MTTKPTSAPGSGIIDFRVRPPFRTFRRLFPNKLAAPESVRDEDLMEAFLGEMDATGIELGVVMGRTGPAPGPFQVTIPNDDVAALVDRYPTRFIGFGSIDVRNPSAALDELDRCADRGFKGIEFDNPLSIPALYDDDRSLMPIYERCVRNKLVIAITSSSSIGPDISYSNPVHIQHVADAFPDQPIVVNHGSWPWTTQMIALAFLSASRGKPNIYFQCDYAFIPNLPGGSDYLQVANTGDIYKKIVFGSSYPAMGLAHCLEQFDRYSFTDPEASRHILRDNAARILGLEPRPA